MRRIRVAAVFIALLLLVICFAVWTWAHFSGGIGVGWAIAIAVLALGYIPVAILGFRLQNPLLRAVAVPSAVSVGLLSFGFVAAVGCWVLAGVARAFELPLGPHSIGYGVFGSFLAVAVCGLVNAAIIRTTRYTVALRGLPAQWIGRTGVLVSDVHLGNIRSVGYSRRVAARVMALKPDVVFIAGDMFDGARVDLDACAGPWRAVTAPLGSFFVTGNHDEFSDSSKITDALRKVGIRVLDNEKVAVDGLQVVGIHDGVAGDERQFRDVLARSQIDRNSASVLLNHQPSQLSIPQEAGISLQLSGHTHKGQFWPWSLLVGRIFGAFAYGLNRLGTLQVITSSGVGTWGPPMRVSTRSEIVRIHFTAA